MATVTESTTVEESVLSSTSRSTFSRKSATYTASTFTAFEYGSSYEYHGMYNNIEGDKDSNAKSDLEMEQNSSLIMQQQQTSAKQTTMSGEQKTSGLFDDLDDLFGTLTAEEVAELSIVDPDDSSTPPSMRCLYHCDKSPSRIVNRKHLIRFLRDNALNAPIIEDIVPFTAGQKRGKTYVQNIKSEEYVQTQSKEAFDIFEPITTEDLEMSQILDDMAGMHRMEDLQEIADVLGVIYQDDCKAEKLTIYPAELPNSIDFEDIIARIEANDPTLTEVTLNNVKNLHSNQWLRLFKALEQANTVLETLHAANCDLKDIEANMIVKALAKNSTLLKLTLDSNLFSAKSVVNILKAIASSKSLKEIRLNNQQLCKRLGHQIEQEIVHIIEDCPQLMRLGLSLEFREPLNRVATILQRNLSANHKIITNQTNSIE